MDGVTVFNTIECGGFDGGALAATIFVGILALVAIIYAILFFCDYDSEGILPLILGGVLTFLCVWYATQINTPKYNEYQVAVDDTVNFNEFQKKYEIVDQNGDLYTVVERSEE